MGVLIKYMYQLYGPSVPQIVRLLAFLPLLLGLAVIMGWYMGNILLIQVHPAFAPMQYNTALGFLVSGVGLLAVYHKKQSVGIWCGIIVSALGALTLAQYATNTNFGIDQLFMDHEVMTKTSHPGRMAPNTALCFVLAGIALINAFLNKSALRYFVLRMAGILVFVLGMVALISYVFSLETGYGWANLTRMAVHTASGFVILGVALTILNQTQQPLQKESSLAFWLSGIVSIILFMLSIILWEEVQKQENLLVEQFVAEELALIKQSLHDNINSSVIALQRMAKRWEVAKGTPEIQWRDDAKHYVADHAALTTVEWADSNYHIRKIEPLKGNEKALGLNIAFNEERRRALEGAAEQGVITLTPPLDLVQGYRAFITYVPIHIDGRFDGFIVGVYNLGITIDNVLPYQFKELFNLQITDSDQDIYSWVNKSDAELDYMLADKLDLFNRSWSLAIWPKKAFVKQHRSQLPELIFIAGIFISMLSGIAIYYAVTAYKRNTLLSQKTMALADSEELYRAIVNSVDGIVMMNQQGVIEKFNTASERIFGYKQHEILGKNITALVPKFSDNMSKEIEGTMAYETSARHKNGTSFIVELSLFQIGLSDKSLAGCVVRDITARKLVESQLKEAQTFQKMIMDNIPDMVFVKDAQYKIVEANPAFLAAYPEDKRNQVLGHTTFESYSKDEQEKFHAEDKKAFAEGFSSVVETINFPDGSVRTLYTNKIRFENVAGEPFILGVARDISDLMKAESEREELIEKLTESNTELERFAYVASHDMQEPLRMVVSFSEILKEDYAGQLEDEAKDYLGMVVDAGQRMQEMISDLLEYSRVNHDAQSFKEVDIAAELEHVLDNLSQIIKERKAEVTHDELPQFYGNPIQIMRLLQNLVANAIKYQPDDRIPKVHVGVEDQGTHWRFYVKDNGMGIEERFIDQIFKPFRRLHSWEQVTGTGLGLAICKKIVENHGGEIWVTSSPGEGSVFSFTVIKNITDEKTVEAV